MGDHCSSEAGGCGIYDLSYGSGSFRRGDSGDSAGSRSGDSPVSVTDLCVCQLSDAGVAVSV